MTPKNGSFTVVVTVPSPQYDGTKLTNVADFTDTTPGSVPAAGHRHQHGAREPRVGDQQASTARTRLIKGSDPDVHDYVGGHRQRTGG